MWLKCRLLLQRVRLLRVRLLRAAMALTPGANDQQLNQARLALARWRRDGAEVCPDSRQHLEAYLLVRKTTPRPRLEKVLAAIASSRATCAQGAMISIKFYLVRRNDFPTGVPEMLQQHLVDVRDIEERFDVGDTNLEMCSSSTRRQV